MLQIAPYVWTPYFFNGVAQYLPTRQQYTPREKAKVNLLVQLLICIVLIELLACH